VKDRFQYEDAYSCNLIAWKDFFHMLIKV